jgi:hypothetical protein
MKVVIFTGIGSFSIPKAVGDYLISNKGWELVDKLPEYEVTKIKKVLILDHPLTERPNLNSYYYTFYMFDDELFRCHDDIIEAYTRRNEGVFAPDYKIVDIPDDVDWYIDECDDGSESIHEKHRIWS